MNSFVSKMDSVSCVLCQRSEETKITGPLSTKEEVTAHQNCLLYSSALVSRESPQFDDLFGFSAHDVMNEVQRGSKLRCSKCKRNVATVGCEEKSCKKSYHYPCAIEAGARPFENKDKGTFGIHCSHCQKTKGVALYGTSTLNSKRRLDFGDKKEKKKARHSNRIISDDSSSSDMTEAGEETLFAPLESDLEEHVSSPADELLNGQKSPEVAPTSHSDHLQENSHRAEAEVATVDTNSMSPLLCTEASEVIMNSSNFWKDCNSAGCTQAIFSDFLTQMTDIFSRITSEEASQQDCDVAFNVMMASGKLGELVDRQQKDLQDKLNELQKAELALKKVALALKR